MRGRLVILARARRRRRVALAARCRRLHRDRRGATTLEWALLLAAVALPSYLILDVAMDTLLAYYAMMTSLNALPFP